MTCMTATTTKNTKYTSAWFK